METLVDNQDINSIVETARIEGFTGEYTPLGGGEVNDTFALDCGANRAILRITKYSDLNNLAQEAHALSLLDLVQVPKLLYFDDSQRVKGRAWIAESYIAGSHESELTTVQFKSLGSLLASVHQVKAEEPVQLDFWANFLDACQHFGDEASLLSHPDERLRGLIHKSREYFSAQNFGSITPSLVHGDVTLSNMLVNGNTVSLIDWEFSKFKDPMADFSTLFYEDMEYNKGKWRIHIKDDQKQALFAGYTEAGGVVDEDRLQVWLNLDKLGSAVYLYWKLNLSGHETAADALAQNHLDLENLQTSLERNL